MVEQAVIASRTKSGRALSGAVVLTGLIGFTWAALEVGTRNAMALTGFLVASSIGEFTTSRVLRAALVILQVALFMVFVATS